MAYCRWESQCGLDWVPSGHKRSSCSCTSNSESPSWWSYLQLHQGKNAHFIKFLPSCPPCSEAMPHVEHSFTHYLTLYFVTNHKVIVIVYLLNLLLVFNSLFLQTMQGNFNDTACGMWKMSDDTTVCHYFASQFAHAWIFYHTLILTHHFTDFWEVFQNVQCMIPVRRIHSIEWCQSCWSRGGGCWRR